MQIRGSDPLTQLRATGSAEDGREVIAVRGAVVRERDEAERHGGGREEDGDAVGEPQFPRGVGVE